MKTLVLMMSMVLACTITGVGQNYIGMSQSKILTYYGEPDSSGDNFISYYDMLEGGVNTYFFDENKNCTSFQITRDNNYLNDYQKMLNREFTKTSDNKYQRKTKKMYFMAEITQSEKDFRIMVKGYENNGEFTESMIVSNN